MAEPKFIKCVNVNISARKWFYIIIILLMLPMGTSMWLSTLPFVPTGATLVERINEIKAYYNESERDLLSLVPVLQQATNAREIVLYERQYEIILDKDIGHSKRTSLSELTCDLANSYGVAFVYVVIGDVDGWVYSMYDCYSNKQMLTHNGQQLPYKGDR